MERNQDPVSDDRREAILRDSGWGQHFTDHIVLADWTPEEGWHDERIVPYYGSSHSGGDLRRSARIRSLVWYGARAPAYVS